MMIYLHIMIGYYWYTNIFTCKSNQISIYIFWSTRCEHIQVTCNERDPDLGTAASGLHVKEADVEKFAG